MCIIGGKMYLTEILSPLSELSVPAPSVGLPSLLGQYYCKRADYSVLIQLPKAMSGATQKCFQISRPGDESQLCLTTCQGKMWLLMSWFLHMQD